MRVIRMANTLYELQTACSNCEDLNDQYNECLSLHPPEECDVEETWGRFAGHGRALRAHVQAPQSLTAEAL
jgi:hypothetical protein